MIQIVSIFSTCWFIIMISVHFSFYVTYFHDCLHILWLIREILVKMTLLKHKREKKYPGPTWKK